jgi:hypothetical protein
MIFVGKPEEKRPLSRPRHMLEDNNNNNNNNNNNMDLRETEWGGMDWIYVSQDRDQWRAILYTVLKLRVP